MLQAPGSFRRALALITLGLIVLSCSERERVTDPPGPEAGTGGPHDAPGAVSDSVTAATGGVLETPGGIRVTIDAGDLPRDTFVTVVPIDYQDPIDQQIAAVRFEPEGLALSHPIVVSLPLPTDWPEGLEPIVLEFYEDDPEGAFNSYNTARLVGEPGNYRAEVLVSHFSGVICATNCHAGTIRFVLDKFAVAGCPPEDALSRIRSRYPDITVPDNGCGLRGAEIVQAFLDTFFDDLGGYDAGESIPATVIDNLIEIAESGHQVVLAYRPGAWGPRFGPHGFYATGAMEYSHTTALEKRDGEWQLRNTLATKNGELIEALGGNTVWFPLRRMSEFRGFSQGVAAEIQYCGEPDCLSFADRNPAGIVAFSPVAGVQFGDNPWSNSLEYLRRFGQWQGIPPRTAVWSAVRIYVQKPGATPNPCDNEDQIAATISLPGYSGPFLVGGIQTDYANWNGDPGHPAMIAVTDPLVSPLDTDRLLLSLRKTIPGPGTYDITGILSTTDANLSFATLQILHEDFPTPVTFVAESGSVTLTSFGTAEGSLLTGTFKATLHGDRIKVQGEETVLEPIDGSISGSFDLLLEDDFP